MTQQLNTGTTTDGDAPPPGLYTLGERQRVGLDAGPTPRLAGDDAAAAPSAIAGERGASVLSGVRTLQSRVTNILAMALIATLGVGLLGWYYVRTASRPAIARHAAQAAAQNKAEGDLRLPPLGRVDPPPAAIASVLGPPPPPPPADLSSALRATAAAGSPDVTTGPQPPPKSAAQLALERRLGGPVSVSGPGNGEPAASAEVDGATGTSSADGFSRLNVAADGGPASARGGAVRAAADGALGSRLQPSITPAAVASILPTQRLLLPKGAFIDCTLETAINSSLPGLTTCVTATDTFGADGEVVLMERGTKLTGETIGTVQQGAARVFVLWTEARTPTGVVIPLASPGTDALGRSGLSGTVNRHFFERFGAAILISMIDGGMQSAVGSQHSTGTVVVNPSASQDVMTEVLKSTIDIPPTVEVNNGDRIQVLVARDLDFRSVYELRSATASR